MDTVLRPLQDKKETLYVLPGSHAQEYARRRFPHALEPVGRIRIEAEHSGELVAVVVHVAEIRRRQRLVVREALPVVDGDIEIDVRSTRMELMVEG